MQLIDNRYQIQGIDVLDIAAEFGLPLYVYDADKIIEKIDALRSAFSGVNLKIKYATKALTNLSILKLMQMQGIDVEVVSVNEARLAQLAGFLPAQIMYTPSGNAWPEIQEALAMGVQLNVDSLSLLEQIGQTYGSRYPVALRINPSIAEGGSFKIQTGHENSKFGISNAYREKIRATVDTYQIPVVGLHVHTGSDFKDSNTFLRIADVLFSMAGDYPNLQFIDFGSGFKVSYREGDYATNLTDLGAKVSVAFQSFCERYGRKIQLCFEPGKLLVSESGHLLVEVNIVKENPTRTFAMVNSGLNHLIRPMMYDAWHTILNVSNPAGSENAGEPRLYDVVGYICETDTFATDRPLPEVQPGDVLSLENAGAYGMSMASNYNLRERPAEVLVYERKPYLIRRRETFEDMVQTMMHVELEAVTV